MIDCQDCKDDIQKCPYCNCACEISAKTINTDEDGYCHRCKKDLYQSSDGLSLLKENPVEKFSPPLQVIFNKPFLEMTDEERAAGHLFFYWRKVNEVFEESNLLRYGQVAFNVLHDLRPGLANKVCGTKADPFYSTKQIDKKDKGDDSWKEFIAFLNSNWYLEKK